MEEFGEEEINKFLENSLKVRNIRVYCSRELKRRFNFEIFTKSGNYTKKYLKWFNKWNDWRKNLKDEDWKKVEEKLKNKEDISEFL
jgi:hypothetical protein